jgi:hypothetical protein
VAKGQCLHAAVPVGAHLAGLSLGDSAAQAYLLGPWDSVWVDPNVWGFGSKPLTDFVVSEASLRLLLLLHCRRDGSFQPGHGVPPRTWAVEGSGSSGLVALEARQQGVFAARLGAMPSAGAQLEGSAGGRRVRQRVAIAATGPLFAADWVEVGSAARMHPLKGAELAGLGAVGVSRLGRLGDSTDSLEARQGPPTSEVRPLWR